MSEQKNKAFSLQQERQLHESFGFATTFHDRQEESMSIIGRVTTEAKGMPLSGNSYWGDLDE